MDSALAQAVQDALARRQAEMLDLLRCLVEINSFSANIAGCNQVADEVERACSKLGLAVQRVPGRDSGDCLVARTRGCAAHAEQVLFCGHMDTVFPPDAGLTAWREDEAHAFGPGVIDMKGGLVAGLYALAALDQAKALGDIPVAFVFNADEETGSIHSRGLIADQADRSAFALVFECAGPGGEVVTARKGRVGYRLDLTGKAAHAGNLQASKSSAVLALAHAVIALEGLNSASSGSTVNVGLVEGGMGPNTVARRASALIDTRFCTAEEGMALLQAVRGAALAQAVPGVEGHLATVSGRPAWEPGCLNSPLLGAAQEAGLALGQEVEGSFRGGVSDANLIASLGVPCLDGLGPGGDFDHSEDEYMVKASLADRAALAALTLVRGWELYCDGRLLP